MMDDLARGLVALLVAGCVFRTLEPALGTLIPSPAGFHSIWLRKTHRPGEAIEGELRLDGEVSPALKRQLRSMTWPTSDEPYMLKQFYVLVGGGR
jgi:hypothetical protein